MTILKKEDTFRKKHLPQLDYIRAFASLSVCFFHLACGNESLLNREGLLYQITNKGWLGVEMFFVLSGFVICWSLPLNYSTNGQLGAFIKKRLIRIEPPYLLSITLVLTLNLLSFLARGLPFEIKFLDLISHLAYLSNFGIGQYFNPVYWTLGVEFQFYLLIAIFFPFLLNSKQWLIGLILISTIVFFELPFKHLFNYFPFFGLGIVIFLAKVHYTNKLETLSIISILILIIITNYGINYTIIASLTSVLITLELPRNSIIAFFSRISYSLYLIHVPIGGKVINLGLRYIDTKQTIQVMALFLSSVMASIFIAYLFYLMAEKPFVKWSKQISY